MKHIAIYYQTKSGQTEKIANYLQQRLVKKNIGVQVYQISSKAKKLSVDPQVDGIIVGGPIYVHKFCSDLSAWVAQKKNKLNSIPSALFSVSLNAADQRVGRREANESILHDFLKKTGWSPGFAASFAGAINYTKYSWFLKRLMRYISKSASGPTDTSLNYELTDWAAVDRFADEFASQTMSSEFSAAERFPDVVHNFNHDAQMSLTTANWN